MHVRVPGGDTEDQRQQYGKNDAYGVAPGRSPDHRIHDRGIKKGLPELQGHAAGKIIGHVHHAHPGPQHAKQNERGNEQAQRTEPQRQPDQERVPHDARPFAWMKEAHILDEHRARQKCADAESGTGKSSGVRDGLESGSMAACNSQGAGRPVNIGVGVHVPCMPGSGKADSEPGFPFPPIDRQVGLLSPAERRRGSPPGPSTSPPRRARRDRPGCGCTGSRDPARD